MVKRALQTRIKDKVHVLLEQEKLANQYRAKADHSPELVELMKEQSRRIEEEVLALARKIFGPDSSSKSNTNNGDSETGGLSANHT